jgi:protease IV
MSLESSSLDADQIVDRRRLRRKLTFWRVATVIIAIVAIVGAGSLAARRTGLFAGSGSGIARITIEGLIRTDRKRVEALDRLSKSKVQAVILHINSPGGTTAGSEELYDALVKLKASKPLVVVVDGLAASGAYVAAMSSDQIIASQNSLVGSIGVIFQYPNVGDLLKTIGVKVEEIKSSPLKAAPNGYEPTSPEARAAIESIVKDSYAWFRNLVGERRGLADAALDRVADGRVFTGRQGIELKLVDALGNEQSAREWLAKEKNIDIKTPVRDYELVPRFSDLPFIRVAMIGLFDAVGLTTFARRMEDWGTVQAVERLNLDGLLALWHPQVGN